MRYFFVKMLFEHVWNMVLLWEKIYWKHVDLNKTTWVWSFQVILRHGTKHVGCYVATKFYSLSQRIMVFKSLNFKKNPTEDSSSPKSLVWLTCLARIMCWFWIRSSLLTSYSSQIPSSWWIMGFLRGFGDVSSCPPKRFHITKNTWEVSFIVKTPWFEGPFSSRWCFKSSN